MSTAKKIALIIALLSVSGVLVHYFFVGKNIEVSNPPVVVSKPTRQQTVEQLISKLQSEREQDPTFKAETARQEKELEQEITDMRKALIQHRKAMSRLDALTIIKTQYEVELSNLQK